MPEVVDLCSPSSKSISPGVESHVSLAELEAHSMEPGGEESLQMEFASLCLQNQDVSPSSVSCEADDLK